MKNNKKVFLVLLILLGVGISCKHSKSHQSESLEKSWIQLFNGQNLDGWKIKIRGQEFGVNYKNTFRVVDGVMQVNYEEYDSFDDAFGHIYYDKEYSDYKFRMEYRFLGNQVPGGPGWAIKNSGIMIHCQDPKTIALNQNFPVSVEVQLLGGLGEGERPTGNVCTPGTHIVMGDETVTRHCINSSSKTYHDDSWVRVELLVRNDSIIKHFINGEEVLQYTRPHFGGNVDADTTFWKSKAGKPLKKGFISLQSESHPVEFRNIEIFELN
jgi:hypothetical protein